ncbi:MAG: hypothetical protein DMD28_09485 [Gemmatimonadetes bacterium]|nr:MAG: hypothetical protein DMD28_09485 [Gemmatimonadota bacterium]
MRGLGLRIVFALVAVAVIAAPAQAQRRRMRGGRAVVSAGPEIGGHVGYNFDVSNAVPARRPGTGIGTPALA